MDIHLDTPRFYVVDAHIDRFVIGPFDNLDMALRFIVDGDGVSERNRHNLCIVQVVAGPSPLV